MTTETGSHNLELEHLFHAAFERTKTRFLSYFLSWLMFFGITIGVVVAALLLAGVAGIIYAFTKSVALTGLLGFVAAIAYIGGLIYVSSWGVLTSTMVLISDKSVSEAMKAVKPIIGKYIGFSLLMGLFLLGIFAISTFTLYILAIVWGIWSAFAIFIFLEEKPEGLQALWQSKAMVQQKFWGILGRLMMVYVALYVVMFAVGYGAASYKALNLVSILLSIFVGPFIISYVYEIYKNVPKVTEAKSSTGWVIASVVGWILIVLVMFIGITSAMQSSAKLNKSVPVQKYDWEKVRPS